MSIVKKYFYNIKCDRCGAIAFENEWSENESDLEDFLYETDFIEKDGKHYCPDCYIVDDNDECHVLPKK